MKFDILSWGAELTPERPAVWFGGRWYSYRDLDDRATRLANHLVSRGVDYGDRVAIVADNHLAHFDLMFAAPKIGFIAAPVDPRLDPAALRRVHDVLRPALVIHDQHLGDDVGAVFDGPCADLEVYRDWVSQPSRAAVPMPPLTPDSIHMVLFDGGQDGAARAVMIPYRQTLTNAQATVMDWDLGSEDCAIQAMPCCQAGVQVLALPLLTIGARVVLMHHFDAGEYLDLAARFDATVLLLSPAIMQALAAHPDFGQVDLRRLRWVIGAEVADAAPARAFRARGVDVREGLMRPEAGVNCFALRQAEAAQYPDSVGQLMPQLRARVQRADGSACANDEVGELLLAGDGLCAGYLHSAQDWNAVYRDGWFHTGELVQRDGAGRYYLRGRRVDLAIEDPIDTGEVEAALGGCAGVREAAVIGLPQPGGRQTALAAVVLEPGVDLDAGRLRTALARRLAADRLPAVITFVAELPRTQTGAVDRRILFERLEDSVE